MSRFIDTRWSHLLGYSGVGALVRADDDLYVVMDIRQWTDRLGLPGGDVIPYVDLLRAGLGIERDLRQPPLTRELPNGAIEGVCVPAVRFPGWMRCPRCGLLHWKPWRRAGKSPEPGQADRARADRDQGPETAEVDGPPRCSCGGNPRLQQVGWVLAHREGGLSDLPWHRLAHARSDGPADQCRPDSQQTYLQLTRDPNSGLGWQLRCRRCRATAPFNPRTPLPMQDPQRQPWERFQQGRLDATGAPAQILEASDPRLYFPRTRSALVIPPESRVRRGSVLDRLYCNRQHCEQIANRRNPRARGPVMRSLAGEYGCSKADIERAWAEIERGYPLYGQSATPGQLVEQEYQALCGEIPDLDDGEDFVPRHRTAAWQALRTGADAGMAPLLAAVDRLVALTRLREVRIFEGFSRIGQNIDDGLRPVSGDDETGGEPAARLVPPDLDYSGDWLPAIELYGEGIFFTLAEPVLRRWAAQPALEQRTRLLERRFEHTGLRFPDTPILPLATRFVLLHTLAHLLIRQLETQAGYPAASIRERIYCSDGENGGAPMAGILVYVAVPDIVGSLGGLAELAEPEHFLRLLASVFAHADWCSADPVCCEHEGQGPSQLNLAACHACALLPEPSCQFANTLLDRVFVRGDLAGAVRPLLDFAGSAD